MPTVRAFRTFLPLLVLGLVLSGCTSSDDTPDTAASASGSGSSLPMGDPKDQSTDVAFTACGAGAFACSGQIDGTPYDIRLPEKWNGSLLIYSHGLRTIDPVAADGPAFEPLAEAAPGLASGVDVVAEALLEDGYALAGAGSPTGGWAIDDAIDSISTVREAFVTNVGVPNRIYTWGQSLGGLAALRSGAANDWVSGSASMCGLLAGLNPNMDLALDAAVGVKALLEPDMKLTDYTSVKQARKAYDRAMKAVTEAALDPTGVGLTKLQVIAAAAEIPTQTRTAEGTTLDQQRVAIVDNLGRALARTTLERFRVEEQLGGNPSTNVGVNYGARVTTDEAALIDAMAGQEGATLALLQQMAALPAGRGRSGRAHRSRRPVPAARQADEAQRHPAHGRRPGGDPRQRDPVRAGGGEGQRPGRPLAEHQRVEPALALPGRWSGPVRRRALQLHRHVTRGRREDPRRLGAPRPLPDVGGQHPGLRGAERLRGAQQSARVAPEPDHRNKLIQIHPNETIPRGASRVSFWLTHPV